MMPPIGQSERPSSLRPGNAPPPAASPGVDPLAWQRGASIVEVVLIAPVALWFVLTAMQLGELVKIRSVVALATTEAVRHGALHHGDVEAMRRRFLERIAPLTGKRRPAPPDVAAAVPGGDAAHDRLDLQVVSPDATAFDDWGRDRGAAPGRYIPNDHLAARDPTVLGPRSGLSIVDANLLRIEVVYRADVRVPWAGPLLVAWLDVSGDRVPTSFARQEGGVAFRASAAALMQTDAHEQALHPTGFAAPGHIDGDTPAYEPTDGPSIDSEAAGEVASGRPDLDRKPTSPDVTNPDHAPSTEASPEPPPSSEPEAGEPHDCLPVSAPVRRDPPAGASVVPDPTGRTDYHGLPATLALPASLSELAATHGFEPRRRTIQRAVIR